MSIRHSVAANRHDTTDSGVRFTAGSLLFLFFFLFRRESSGETASNLQGP